MEDTVSSTRLRIRMQVEQAMNEVTEFFSSILFFLFPQNTPKLHSKGSQIPHTAMEELKQRHVLRDMFSLSVNVTGLTPDFINGNFLPKGYESR